MDYDIIISGSYILLEPWEDLTSNRIYTVTIMPGVSGYDVSGVYYYNSEYSFSFTSLYCPIFTTPTKVRLEAGPGIDSISDDTIYKMIHKNSLDAVDLANQSANSQVAYDYWGCSWHNVPIVLRRYVECKTAYDLLCLMQTINPGTGNNASQLKTLGDMTIRYGSPAGGGSSAGDPSKRKQLYDCWMEMLNGIKALAINWGVRGYYNVSKGFAHPAYDPDHNRVIRTVDFKNSQPSGPWERATYWRSNI